MVEDLREAVADETEPAQGYDVFVSYSRADREAVIPLTLSGIRPRLV